MAIIKSPSAAAPNPASQNIHGLPERRDGPQLLKQLQADSAEARRWAARDLVDCPESSAALVRQLQAEPEASVREVILTTLVRLGDAQSVAGLVDCMRSEDASLRNEAIEALKQLPTEVAPIMRQLLSDEDSDMRIFAVNVLESLRHPLVESWLAEVIQSDPHVNVCATAVDLLGEVGSREVLEPLLRLKDRFAREPYIQFAADLAIKRIIEG
jgi:HEAT repeat protein